MKCGKVQLNMGNITLYVSCVYVCLCIVREGLMEEFSSRGSGFGGREVDKDLFALIGCALLLILNFFY